MSRCEAREKTTARCGLVAVVVGLVGAFDLHADVVGLFLGQGGQLDAQTGQVQAGHFFVQFLGQGVDLLFQVALGQLDLGQGLVGEAVGQDEACLLYTSRCV